MRSPVHARSAGCHLRRPGVRPRPRPGGEAVTVHADPPCLSPRRRQMVALTALGLDPEEIAAELGITGGGVRSHLRDARISVGTETDRAITYHVLAGKGVDLSRLPEPPTGLLDELTCGVLRGLRYDVADKKLATTISRAHDMPVDVVEKALDNARSATGLSDCGLLGLTFAAGILSGREGVTSPLGSVPVPAASGIKASSTYQPIPPGQTFLQQSRPRPAPRPRPPVADPLKLLPGALPAQKTGTRPPLCGLQGSTAVAGNDVQPVRVSVEVCRDVLQRLHDSRVPPQEWGPVLASSEGRYTVFMLRPGSLPDQWRYAGSRVLRPGTVLHLPPHTTPSGPLYWAVPPAAWWNPDTLMPLITGESPRRTRHPKELPLR
ncbi:MULTISPECIES: helix-turn-helix transcriptional regulator [unclassified Streptomyces]|uniref:helix-turn-helix transcriptional regulator n=1 Tax=unclassified Streptomyces TaxID=2593676 RepID=UPI0035E31BA4